MHPSNVDYGTAKSVPAALLEQRIASGIITLDVDLTAKVLERIRLGLLTSSRTINEVADYCRQWWS